MTAPVTFQTAQRIIRMAYKDAGIVQDGDDPDGEQYVEGLNRLNDIANFEQTQGLKLFLLSDVAIPLVVGKAQYVLSPAGDVMMTKPLRVLQAYYLDSSGIRRPLTALSWDEYVRLSQPAQNGAINSYFVDKRTTQINVNLWLVPDATAATGSVHVIVENQATSIVSITDNIMFPIEWALFLRWALADELSTGQPQSIMQRCAQKAEMYRRALEDWDVEDASTMFAVDVRVGQTRNSFS